MAFFHPRLVTNTHSQEYASCRFSLAFQCVVSIGVRGSKQIQRRVIQTLNGAGCILEAWLASKSFSVRSSSNASGLFRETREQRLARRLATIENRFQEERVVLTKALQRTQMEQSAAQRPPENQLQTRSQDDEVSTFVYVLPRH